MKKINIVAAALCVAIAGIAAAGSKFTGNGNVVIARNSDGSGAATGVLGSIYNGPDATQWIACQRGINDAVFCNAFNAATNQIVSCAVTSAYLAQSVASMSPDARVQFWWNAQGTCTRIQVTHSSEYEDKQG
jgi:hypothetical protein